MSEFASINDAYKAINRARIAWLVVFGLLIISRAFNRPHFTILIITSLMIFGGPALWLQFINKRSRAAATFLAVQGVLNMITTIGATVVVLSEAKPPSQPLPPVSQVLAAILINVIVIALLWLAIKACSAAFWLHDTLSKPAIQTDDAV